MDVLKVDSLIVGQGLAGTLLFRELRRKGEKVLIIDKRRAGEASRVASGMWNPLTFRLILKSWRVDELLPVALQTYAELEAECGLKLLYPLRISRVIPDEKYGELWQTKSNDPEFSDYVKPLTVIPSMHKNLRYPAGRGIVEGAGWLDLVPFLDTFRKQCIESETLLEDEFRMQDVKLTGTGVCWKNVEAKRIIFCEGSELRHNPWFNWLPTKPAQGDVLTLHIPNLNLDEIYNGGFFILPLGDNNYRVGATYEWENLSPTPTEKGKAELLEKFTQAYKGDFTLVDHKAGIRPTVADRRPILGSHPEFKQLAVFNGLGTKGVMIAPFFAKRMAEFLLDGKPLEDEININRFRKRYEKSK